MTEQRTASQLTVVIPTLGRECLRDSVQAIAQGSMLPAEIVLSHQGEIGAMDAMLRDFRQFGIPIRYLHSHQRGAAAGRNAGIRAVNTNLFGTTDDDCNVDFRWLEAIVSALEKFPKAIVTGRVLAGAPGAPSTISTNSPRIYTRIPLQGGHFSGGNFGAAVAVFNDIGPFDESELVRYCEDPEWSFRALARNYPIHYIPAITVTHVHWRNEEGMAQLYSQYAYSQGGWFGRKLRDGDLSFLIRLLYELARGSKRWCLGALRGDTVRKVNGRAYVIDILRGIAAGWRDHGGLK